MIPIKKYFVIIGTFLIAFSFGFSNVKVKAIPPKKSNQIFSYVVIGAFTFHNNAKRFTSYAGDKSLDAWYGLQKERNLYYVYAFKFANKEQARVEAIKLQSTEEFADAWVYDGQLEEPSGGGGSPSTPAIVDTEPDPTVNVDESSGETVNFMADEIPSQEEPEPDYSDEPVIEIDSQAESPEITKKEGEYLLYLNTIHLSKFKEVLGKVQLIDPVRAKKLTDLESHNIVKVKDPGNGKNTVKLATNIFGFRPVEHIIDLQNPVVDSTSNHVEMLGDSIIVNFDLERYHKGDIMVMYNVYFFKDAAIMRPESKFELNSLLDMLKENEALRIRIHGHTNGNSHGKFTALDKKSDDIQFFSLKADHIEANGSAKRLSEERAYTIQHYLMSEGVEESRMDIQGWGGKKMLYDKHDTQAKKNVRVEVEILEE